MCVDDAPRERQSHAVPLRIGVSPVKELENPLVGALCNALPIVLDDELKKTSLV